MEKTTAKPKATKLPIRSITAALIALIILGAAALMIEASVAHSSICANTASREGRVEWKGGRTSGEWNTPSALETYLRGKGMAIEHRWVPYAANGRNLFGGTLARSHGDPGAIMNIRDEVLAKWITSHSHDEIIALYQLFMRDNQDEITAKIAGIYESYYEGQPTD